MVRIRTTGGGGWGNPLERDPELVVRDVVWRKVSPEAALADYGVVLTGSLDDDSLGYDAAATAPSGPRDPRRPRRSSTGARATRSWPRVQPPRTWTGCRSPGSGRSGDAMNTRVAVVGGTGKTGRAVTAALAARGAEAVPLGRAAWIDLAGALAGCDAAYVIAPNMHPDEAAYVEAGDRRRAPGRGVAAGAALGGVAVRPGDAAPRRQGPGRGRRTPLRPGLDDPVQPGAYVQNFAAGTTIRLPYRADAPFGFADLDDVGEVAARVLLEDGHEGATYELASFRAPSASWPARSGRPSRWSGRGWAASRG